VLLAAVARVPGTTVDADATVHSEGILGVIGTPRERVDAYLDGARQIERQLSDYAAKRVAVVSTGSELVGGKVEDTNFLAIRSAMETAGYEVDLGGVAGDSEREIAGLVARLSSEGYGLIITTGGVGAEEKDRTIEALALLDGDLRTAPLAHYRVGHGRHVKDSVRIGIARLGWSTIVALPGPTHEVKLALPVLLNGLRAGASPGELIEAIATPLRATLPRHPH
jgi:molybdenum cofactor synthesis domain-containing protein